jgi:membrane protease YdiL (CAAX protease family)
MFVGLQALQVLVVVPSLKFSYTVPVGIYKVFFYFVLVGFTEELWFRGIWFAAFKNRFLPCVLIGSILFAVPHVITGGPTALLVTFLVGLVFAAARYRGASVLSLTIVHGAVDYLNDSVCSGGLRFGLTTTLAVAVAWLTALAVFLLVAFRIKGSRNQ